MALLSKAIVPLLRWVSGEEGVAKTRLWSRLSLVFYPEVMMAFRLVPCSVDLMPLSALLATVRAIFRPQTGTVAAAGPF